MTFPLYKPKLKNKHNSIIFTLNMNRNKYSYSISNLIHMNMYQGILYDIHILRKVFKKAPLFWLLFSCTRYKFLYINLQLNSITWKVFNSSFRPFQCQRLGSPQIIFVPCGMSFFSYSWAHYSLCLLCSFFLCNFYFNRNL